MPSPTLTTQQAEALQQRAVQAAGNAYAPYSGFRVGAAVLLSDSTVVTGCNVENASYRLTTCAEQNAITCAIAQCGPAIRIVAVAVANLNNEASQPCGACRQTILEFSTPETVIYFPNADGSYVQSTMAELLPAAFHLDQ